MIRLVKLDEDDYIESFTRNNRANNPCGCGGNVFTEEFDGENLLGVCSCCRKDIYKFVYDEDYIKNSKWKTVTKRE